MVRILRVKYALIVVGDGEVQMTKSTKELLDKLKELLQREEGNILTKQAIDEILEKLGEDD